MRGIVSNIAILLAILFAAYGLCILALRSGSRFYLVWLVLAAMLAGLGYNEPEPEGEGMARYLIERGLDGDRIQIENRSENTVQNMTCSAAYLDPATDRVAVVTNNFHVYRSLGLARGAGYQNVSGIAAPSDLFYLPNNMLRETCGLLKDWLAGNM